MFEYAFHPRRGTSYPDAGRRAADNEAGILDGDSASTPSLGNGVLDWRRTGDNAVALSHFEVDVAEGALKRDKIDEGARATYCFAAQRSPPTRRHEQRWTMTAFTLNVMRITAYRRARRGAFLPQRMFEASSQATRHFSVKSALRMIVPIRNALLFSPFGIS
ncbi:hypothetical protein CPLU01_01791 [Colletotrichum plurivorum]|uniref:Uncharacterized protein n=1 Tax=Colletotrichum plurivorum TaxID=2175906 RepID=A0A8H6NNM8_9PEZI|nr:hypothetical protein CPLU01_01791 [Colletotrichum plurivorum]